MIKAVYKKKVNRGPDWLADRLCMSRVAAKRDALNIERGHRMAIYANDYIGISINQYGVYEGEELDILFDFLQPVLKDFQEGVALDIGANIGNHSLYFSNKFSRVMAFEANPHTYELLKFNTGFCDNVEVFCTGLGDEKGTCQLVENTRNFGGSYLTSHGKTDEPVIDVPVDKLDDFITGNERIDFIKVDVEGFEERVLRGAAGIISKHQPIIVFEQDEKEFVGGSTPCIEFLREQGYAMYWQSSTLQSKSWLGRRLINIYDFCFGKTINIKTGDQIPRRFHSMLIAIPPGTVLS